MGCGLAGELLAELREELVEFLGLNDVPGHNNQLIGMQHGDEVGSLLGRDDLGELRAES